MANSIKIKKEAKQFQQCRSLEDMAALLRTSASRIRLFSAHPRYHIYNIRKPNGKTRLIEDPIQPAKIILKRLNDYLQASYHARRPSCVHGFCISAGDEVERNIVSNARQHLGKAWLLNIDFRDFFHSILAETVQTTWRSYFKRYNKELSRTLTGFTCFNNRLPMGSPTSPVLSNFASICLDEELMPLCEHMGITYTRFADDCSFSSQERIDGKTVQLIRDCITRHRFIINEEKVKLYGPDDVKMITGIVAGKDDLSLPEGYLHQIEKEIERLRDTLLVETRFQTGMSLKKLKLFEQEVRGKVNYAVMVLGRTTETTGLQLAFEDALHPPADFESGDWLDIPYNFF